MLQYTRLFHEGNGKVCTRVGQGLGNGAGGAAGGIGGNDRKQNGTGYAARSLPERVPVAILSWGKGVRDLLSGDRAKFGFPLAPAGSCAVFFQ